MDKPIYVIDGSKFSSLDEFAEYFSKLVLKDYQWHGNLDAFNDILYGGFGTPEGGFVLHWKNSDQSRIRLGHAETGKWLEERIANGHPSHIPHFENWLVDARKGQGKTLFDMIVEIINSHALDNSEAEGGIELFLL